VYVRKLHRQLEKGALESGGGGGGGGGFSNMTTPLSTTNTSYFEPQPG